MGNQLACPRCSGTHLIRFGKVQGRQRWRCRECRRTWNDLLGTPLFHLHTSLSEIVQSIRVVLHRGSLRAAEEQTGHNYDTIATWIRRLGTHADTVTEILAQDLVLSEVEIDEFWSFVGKKGGPVRRRGQPILPNPRRSASTGDV
jgi:transposase-like protein